MNTKHTPGPWRQHMVEETLVIGADGSAVAHMTDDYESEWPVMVSNARLIAAAPELLAALVALVERGTDSPEHLAAEAAIAKATGEQA